MRYFAGVGSRDAQFIPSVMEEIESIAYELVQKSYILRSGGADGADTAFEKGVDRLITETEARVGCARGMNRLKQIFLPWRLMKSKRFPEGHPSPLYHPSTEALEMARELLGPSHWGNLKESWRLMHARNCHQVLGANLDSPVDFVLCWTPYGKETGGTATAIKLARRHNIPVINMATKGWRQALDII